MPTQNQNPGNFANNPSRAEAGRKGGQNSHASRSTSHESGRSMGMSAPSRNRDEY
ncbi:MAG: general stress protein [Alphaproteobacteria bacterium]|nr:MAG: general stress protein [Alphaproteobacteria bacterium]